LFVHTDITQEGLVKAAVEQTIAQFGGLDILVNNAGTNFYFNASEMTSEDWDKAMGVDLKGAWLCAKYAIPPMLARGGGVIINIASVHSFMTAPGMFPYAVAKSGLVGMTRSLALDWGKQRIRPIAVSPGWVKTPLVSAHFERQPDPHQAEARVADVQPIGRIGAPRDIANLVAFLASDDASYITGTEIVIDGGISAKYAT
jgi:NAD(P)-dependent dehydrogenase (short-subunit alcohol dehydrogenase family)